MSQFDRADPGQDHDYCDGLEPSVATPSRAAIRVMVTEQEQAAATLALPAARFQEAYDRLRRVAPTGDLHIELSMICPSNPMTPTHDQPGLYLERVQHLHCGGRLYWHQRPYADSNQVYEMVLRCETCGAEDPPADQRDPAGAVCWTQKHT